MKRRKNTASVAANPILIGAVTTVVVLVAVFLAYNANKGLPFVPTFTLKVEVQNAERLVVGNEVREGGERVGQVAAIDPLRLEGGKLGAQLELQLDRRFSPIPDDTTFVVRSKGTLGLKYIDQVRGSSSRAFVENSVVAARPNSTTPELDDFFSTFDAPTRENVRRNLDTYAAAFAGRGVDVNRTFAALPELLTDLSPVMRTLSAPDTNLKGFFGELADLFRVVGPVTDDLVDGFTTAADTFEAFSRDPEALDRTIAESPETLDVAIRELPVQRQLFRALAQIGDETTAAAAALRTSAPVVSRALAAGTGVLPETVELSDDLRRNLTALGSLGRSPLANLTLGGLRSTAQTTNPSLQYLGPHVTVCNYFNYFWTFFADHLSERVPSGTLQRIEVKEVPPGQTNGQSSFGATRPSDGTGAVLTAMADPAALHAQPYGRAVNEQGAADCEQGQRGYLNRVAKNAPPGLNVAVDPRTPGDQGPTFTGKPRVPAGQTFSAEPAGKGPKVNLP
ncbi:MAG: Mammalian cell entry related domain protein [Solirubrobacterales bacterium]|jgi:ABC-type transporter Mla subunit MlaD|nr:Mammalian cell entry related domain protein [Solirubrobacterales bacterium]